MEIKSVEQNVVTPRQCGHEGVFDELAHDLHRHTFTTTIYVGAIYLARVPVSRQTKHHRRIKAFL